MKVHGKRSLLNPPGYQSTGAIVAEVEDSSAWKKDCDATGKLLVDSGEWSLQPTATLQFSDCDRVVRYIIEFHDSDSRKGSLNKIDKMIDALNLFRVGVVTEQERYVERKKKFDTDLKIKLKNKKENDARSKV